MKFKLEASSVGVTQHRQCTEHTTANTLPVEPTSHSCCSNASLCILVAPGKLKDPNGSGASNWTCRWRSFPKWIIRAGIQELKP